MTRPTLTRSTRRRGQALAAVLALAALAALAAGCAETQTPTPGPTPGPSLTVAELKVRLIDGFGPLWFCDPDLFPIARGNEADLAIERFPEIQADAEAFEAIVAHLRLDPGAEFTADQKLEVYRAWKQLNAISLQPGNDDIHRFDYLNVPAPGASDGRRTVGTIGARGQVLIEQQAAAGEPICPICLARATWIDTPRGQVAVEDLGVGMDVWSVDDAGRRIVATIVLIGRTPVPANHQVVELRLADGRVVRASPGHPLADGRLLGSVRVGDAVDGSRVIGAERAGYDGGWTYDLLPDGPTGHYFADGVLLGSTLGGGRED